MKRARGYSYFARTVRGTHNTYLTKVVREIQSRGEEPIPEEVISWETTRNLIGELEITCAEDFFMHWDKISGHRLTNSKNAGLHGRPSRETCELIRNRHLGKPKSLEHREKLRTAAINREITDKFRKACSEAQKINQNNPETKKIMKEARRHHYHPVVCVTDNLEFDGLGEAARHYGLRTNQISAVLYVEV